MITQKQIDEFLEEKRIAVAGVSRDKTKFGYQIYSELIKKGYEAFPINPNIEVIDGEKCYQNLSELPDDVKSLLIITNKKQTLDVFQESIKKGISNVWIQQTSETPDSIEYGENQNINFIYKKCLFMFLDEVKGVHKFHKTIMDWFGKLPK